MTKNFTYVEKHSGDPLSHTEWNNLAQDVDALVTGVNNGTIGGSSQGGTDPHVSFDEVANGGKNNLTIATTAEDQYQDGSKTKGGKINIEPISDLQIKPGDDVSLCSHHREDPTEVSVKVLDGEDNPVKLQLNAANIVLTTKDKNKTKVKDANGDDTNEALYDDPNVLNVTVNSGKNTRGYLKVRAQAIDLRCEENGGIALQPKGSDGEGHENKIKFEHDGGDGVEFGTFNSEKTSIYTDEYRFKDDGQVYAVTRGAVATQSYKEDGVTPKKVDYPTQSDDFKDIITSSTPHASWNSIVNAGKNAYKLSYFAVATGVYVVPLTEMPADTPPDYKAFTGFYTPFQHTGFYDEDQGISKTVNVGDIYTDNTLASKITALPYASSTGNERVHYLKSPSFWEDFFGYVAPVTLLPNPGQDPLYDAVQFYAQNQYLVFKVSDQYYCLVPSSEVVDMMINVPKHGWLSLGDLKTMLSNA